MKALSFKGRGTEYFKIWIVNVLLTIITLGFYYPWAKVRTKRYFSANTELEGRNFEYHATGKQLLFGFIISIVLLFIFITLQELNPTLYGIMFIIGVLLMPWVVWRSVKFNMRMTSFSNVRFAFDGTLGGSYFAYLLLPIIGYLIVAAMIAAPAFGIEQLGPSNTQSMMILASVLMALLIMFISVYVYAYIKKRHAGYLINGYRFGQGRFKTDLTTGGFAKIVLKTWVLGLLLLILALVIVVVIAILSGLLSNFNTIQDAFTSQDPEAISHLMGNGALILVPVLYFFLILISFVVIAYGYTRSRSYIMENSLLDGKVGFASTLSASSMAWLMVTNLLLVIFTLGLGMPWAKVRMARLIVEHTEVDTEHGFDEYITQRQKEQSALGEQIGDAFDVDVGIGF